MNLTQYCLEQSVKTNPTKPAIIEVYAIDKYKVYAYQDLYQQILNVAQSFYAMKLPKGSHVLIRTVKNVDFLIVYFAAMAAGLVPIATMPELKEIELQGIVDSANPALFYCLSTLQLNLSLPTRCIAIDEIELQKLKKTDGSHFVFNTDSEDPAFTVFTSGSSGPPKGVVHAHRNVIGREPIRRHWSAINKDDIVLVTGKPCWTYSMGTGFFDTFAANATALLYEAEIEEDTWFHLIEKYRVTLLASSPMYYKKMVNLMSSQTHDLSSLRRLLSAGEALPEIIFEHFAQYGLPIYQALGMTECPTFVSAGDHAKPSAKSLGKVQPGRKVSVRDINDINKPAAENETGILAVHRDELAFMLGYLDPNTGKPIKMKEDWFDSRDRVSQDHEGYLYYMTRSDAILNLNSARIAPHEIESELLMINGVIDAACGVKTYQHKPDELWAFIVADKDKQLTEKMIIDYVATRLSSRRTPRKIIFVDSLPKNANGKLARKELDKLIEAS
jgi:acyl-coenzyme A synthetase/AMP-(fatty) acid ligase